MLYFPWFELEDDHKLSGILSLKHHRLDSSPWCNLDHVPEAWQHIDKHGPWRVHQNQTAAEKEKVMYFFKYTIKNMTDDSRTQEENGELEKKCQIIHGILLKFKFLKKFFWKSTLDCL